MAPPLIASSTASAKRGPKMPCPHCGESWESKVIDSRGGALLERRVLGVYRRRECVNCGGRFTTHEIAVVHN